MDIVIVGSGPAGFQAAPESSSWPPSGWTASAAAAPSNAPWQRSMSNPKKLGVGTNIKKMKRKTLRLYLVLISLALLGIATALVLNAFDRELVFFFSPSEIAAEKPAPGRVIRLGGLVETGSVSKLGDGATVSFRVTDLKAATEIAYRGVLPDLFREGQGVVVEGAFNESGNFVATQVLAKHDENYLLRRQEQEALVEAGAALRGLLLTVLIRAHGSIADRGSPIAD